MNRRAFTLIELLVVIAIIAILAAILFPVFAQAKLAAKKTSSLSNIKQTSLSAIMYEGDVDDMLPLSLSGAYANLGCPTSVGCRDGLPDHSNTWVFITQPYMKSLAVLVDPGLGDPDNIFGSGANAWFRNQNRYPQYGYNYMFLSPFYACENSVGRSATAAAKPAETVFFTTSQVFTTVPNRGFYGANAPGAWPIISPAPNACAWYDGSTGSGNWSAKNPANIGKITSSVRIKQYSGANVAWVDGHAKYLNDSALAAGTDYGSASYNNGNEGAQITDLSKYLWSLDGTLNDLSL